jgi:hypothetical protein
VGDKFLGLMCAEMPETRFEDLVRVCLDGTEAVAQIDPRFIAVCEPGTIEVVGLVASCPITLGAEVLDSTVKIMASCSVEGVKVTARISGIRLGHRSRFPEFSQEQMVRNNDFWSQAHDVRRRQR